MTGQLPENINLGIDYSRSELRTIYVAGGCFWGVEAYMRRVMGVAETTVGYANGITPDPTYEQVCGHRTGHAETVRVRYDPAIVPLASLLRSFFSIIDPTSLNRQGGDIGNQYRTGIYFEDPADGEIARNVAGSIAGGYGKEIVTEIEPLQCFYPAEEYHQSYLEKNPGGYCHIRF